MTESIANWFVNDGLHNFESVLTDYRDKPVRFLQIGAYTGDATVWMVENVLTNPNSVLVDVDTWEGSDEPSHHQMNWTTVENIYDARTRQARLDRKVVKFKTTSDRFFKNNIEMYDFVYVDGDHTSPSVLKDAFNSFDCLKSGGVIAFDDYLWSTGSQRNKEPKMAIDSFRSIYSDQIEVLIDGYQFWVRKTS